ncbi:hypothetical protein [Desulfobotulus alkaliphilus]|uniref:hypothetical protein n=1 Tax=Desulfobotulus alkaliphilus TaxID=622671 RepID=UPI001C96E224|nr:hypothetical protein [Desulfobotulus alkaliphilus]
MRFASSGSEVLKKGGEEGTFFAADTGWKGAAGFQSLNFLKRTGFFSEDALLLAVLDFAVVVALVAAVFFFAALVFLAVLVFFFALSSLAGLVVVFFFTGFFAMITPLCHRSFPDRYGFPYYSHRNLNCFLIGLKLFCKQACMESFKIYPYGAGLLPVF